MTKPARVLLLVSLLLMSLLAASSAGGGGRRAFIVLAHAGQVGSGASTPLEGLTAFALLDERTGELSFTVDQGDPSLLWSLAGPAAPGQQGEVIANGSGGYGVLEAGALDKARLRALRRGELYLEFVRPTALPELQRARGQLLPIARVRYPALD